MTAADWDRQETAELIARARRDFPGGSYPGKSYMPELDQEIAEVKASMPYPGGSAGAVQWWLKTGQIESKSIVEDAAGQILVPKDLVIDVLNVARSAGMLRDLVTVRPTNRLAVPIGTLGAATVSWVKAETGGTPPDAAVAVAASGGGDIVVADLMCLVKVGTDELDDSPAAVTQMLAEVLGDAVAEAEDLAIASGSGSGQPAGLTLSANLARIPGAQKLAAGTSNTPTLADVTSIPWKLPDRYRSRASWLLHPTAASKIAALTWSTGAPLWPAPGNPDPKTGGGLLGWPAYVVPGLPDPATAGTTDAAVLFGDFKSAYRLVDRQRMTLQRLEQRYADTGTVGILLRHRIGGDLLRPGALAVYTL